MSHLHWHNVLWCIVVLVALLALYVAYMFWEAYVEVKGAPREEMFLCNKHGFLSPKHLITFAEAMDIGTGKFDQSGKEIIERKKVQYCSLCWHENMKKAEQVGK
jgi:hypothetical protein